MKGRLFAVCAIIASTFALFPQTPRNAPSNEDEARLSIVVSALDWFSVPYQYAGHSREGTDCSGFVSSVLEVAGCGLAPRTVSAFAGFGVRVPGEPRPGDILLFYEDDEPVHVGICLGNGTFIHAASQGPETGVIISNLEEQWYKLRFSHARNVISGGAK